MDAEEVRECVKKREGNWALTDGRLEREERRGSE